MKCRVIAYPYAVQRGTIEVPDHIPEEDIDTYIEDCWGEIEFDAPELDYHGTDFDWHIVEESMDRF